jgi:hypothetical protein
LASFSWGAVPVDPKTDDPIGKPIYQDVLVWAVTLEGVCEPQPIEGNPQNAGGVCVSGTQTAIIDASTGKFIVGYATSE